MSEATPGSVTLPVPTSGDVLTDLLRQGAQRMLAEAIEAEVAEWLDSRAHLKNEAGHRQVVRNGL